MGQWTSTNNNTFQTTGRWNSRGVEHRQYGQPSSTGPWCHCIWYEALCWDPSVWSFDGDWQTRSTNTTHGSEQLPQGVLVFDWVSVFIMHRYMHLCILIDTIYLLTLYCTLKRKYIKNIGNRYCTIWQGIIIIILFCASLLLYLNCLVFYVIYCSP